MLEYEGFIVRAGTHWGGASLEWAARRMAYRGRAHPRFSAGDVDVLVFGEPESCTTEEGVHLFATEFEAVEGQSFREAYAAGCWRTDAAQVWSTSMMLAIDPSRKVVDILIGEFCEGSRYFAAKESSFFFAPEIKAFSNVGGLDEIHRPDSGFRIGVPFDGSGPVVESRQSGWPLLECPYSYEAAVGRCRELLEEGLDRALAVVDQPYAVSFSGGIDSGILVQMLANRGLPIHAFTAWFDDGTGRVPSDLGFARRLARDLGFELNEVRVEESRIEPYLRRSLYYGERRNEAELEGSIYFLPLLEAIRDRGFRARMSGDGNDAYFAGYHLRIDYADPVAFRNQYLRMLRWGLASHIASFQDLFGIRLCEPFASKEILSFGLSLPQEYLVKIEDGHFVGKRLLRDAFRGDVPDYILDRKKENPRDGSGTREVLDRMFGGSTGRNRVMKRARRRLLEPPNLKFVPAWAVRKGWMDGHTARRMETPIRP